MPANINRAAAGLAVFLLLLPLAFASPPYCFITEDWGGGWDQAKWINYSDVSTGSVLFNATDNSIRLRTASGTKAQGYGMRYFRNMTMPANGALCIEAEFWGGYQLGGGAGIYKTIGMTTNKAKAGAEGTNYWSLLQLEIDNTYQQDYSAWYTSSVKQQLFGKWYYATRYYNISMCINSTHYRIYFVNGSSGKVVSYSDVVGTYAPKLTAGNQTWVTFAGSNNGAVAITRVRNIRAFNSSTSNLFKISNLTVSYGCSSEGPAPPNSTLSVIFRNTSNAQKSIFRENEAFYALLNFSVADSQISDAVCNITIIGLFDATFNASTGLYAMHPPLSFASHGSKPYVALCNNGSMNATATGSIYVWNVPPLIALDKIVMNRSSHSLNNASLKLEYEAGFWKWHVNVTDDDANFFKYVWRNESDIILQSINTSIWLPAITNSSFFLKVGSYNFSLLVNDTAGNKTYASVAFTVNDTISPACSGLNHSIAGSYVYSWAVACHDEYFFSFNISCSNGYSFHEDNIAAQAYSFSDTTIIPPADGAVTCLYEYCDGHTSREIKPMSILPDFNSNSISFDGIAIRMQEQAKAMDWERQKDRYVFCFEPEQKVTALSFEIPDGCYPAKNSPYQGHLVCPASRTWIDFVNPRYKVGFEGNYVVVTSLDKQPVGRACFESVGKFNCVSGEQYLIYSEGTAAVNATLTMRACPETTASMMGLWIFVIIALFLMYLGFAASGIAGVFGAILLMGCSWYASPCQAFLAYVVGAIGIVLVILFAIKAALQFQGTGRSH